MSTESILGSHHVFSVLCFVGVFICLDFPRHFIFSSPLFCAHEGPFSVLLAPSRVGQSQLLAFVRSRATLKIPYLLRNILLAYQHVKSTSASPNTLVFCIWKLSVGVSSDPSR